MTQADRRFFVEFDTSEDCPLDFGGDPSVLLYFISWAFTIRFGGTHELAQAALRMQRAHKVDLRPLMRYADRDVEDDEDRHALETAWQPAAPVAASARAAADALDSDDAELHALAEEYADLAPRLRNLASMCDWATERDARVRLSFLLA